MKNSSMLMLLVALLLGFCSGGVMSLQQIQTQTSTDSVTKGGPVVENQLMGVYTAINSGPIQITQQINVTFTLVNIGIKGCNFHNSKYTYSTQLKLVGFSSTQMACDKDEDSIVLAGMIRAVKVKNDGDFLIFYDNIGTEVLRLLNQFGADLNSKAFLTPVNVSGSYKFRIPPLHLLIKGNIYTLTGCNIHTFRYKKDPRGSISFDGFTSINRTCDVNFDAYYLNAFKRARIIIESRFNIKLFDLQGRLLLNMQQLILNSLDLRYYVSFGDVEGEIFQNLLKYKGCNTNTLRYAIEGENTIAFSNILSTKTPCSTYDYDDLINQALESANKFEVKADTIQFRVNDNIVMVAYKTSSTNTIIKPPPTRVNLQGNFMMRVINSNLPVANTQIDNKQIRCFQCDVIWVSYQAYSDGTFKIVQMVPKTKKDCFNDKNNEYYRNLKSVTSFRRDQTGAGFYLLKDDKSIVNLEYVGDTEIEK